MKQQLTFEVLKEFSVIKEEDKPSIKKIYAAVVENSTLTLTDFLTIRDILTLTEYNDASIHLLLLCLFSSLLEGSVCVKLDELTLAKRMKRITGADCSRYAKEIVAAKEKYPRLIALKELTPSLFSSQEEDFKPVVISEEADGLYVYFQKYYHFEEILKENLIKLTSRQSQWNLPDEKIKDAFWDISRENPLSNNGKTISLSSSQMLAVLLPAINDFIIISGGPGTGKTSIIVNLVRLLLRLDFDASRIMMAAPTGRAMQHLNDSLLAGCDKVCIENKIDEKLKTVKATTIHRLLKYRPSRNLFFYNAFNPIPADVIIVDEVSMVDIIMMGKLLEAAGPDCKIILLGDRNQLPSVEAGSVLADLIPDEESVNFSEELASRLNDILPLSPTSKKENRTSLHLIDKVVILNENFRSETSIVTVAESINKQNSGVVKNINLVEIVPFPQERTVNDAGNLIAGSFLKENPFDDKGVFRINPKDKNKINYHELGSILDIWADEFFLSSDDDGYFEMVKTLSSFSREELLDDENNRILDKLFIRMNMNRILTPLRHGFSGTGGINGYLSRRISKFLPETRGDGIFPGMPIIIMRNDYNKSLFNGDTGITVLDNEGYYYAAFLKTEGIVLYPIEVLPSFEPSFAITIHKSQGSEYSSVLLVVPDNVPESLMTKEILYTALTRAKERVLIYGSQEILEHSIENRIVRESGIQLWQ